jgi:hypothetical protein
MCLFAILGLNGPIFEMGCLLQQVKNSLALDQMLIDDRD